MEPERTGNHHTALTRDLPLGPMGDNKHFIRHDPMRLPDVHLRRAEANVRAVSQERERHNRSRKNNNDREYQRPAKPERVRDAQQVARLKSRVRQRGDMRQTTQDTRGQDLQYGDAMTKMALAKEHRLYNAKTDETKYFDPRLAARMDFDYERSSPQRAYSGPEQESSRTSKDSAKENKRVKQKELTWQTTRETRRERDYKNASIWPYPEFLTASSSDSDTILDPPRYSRREEEERRRERDPYSEQPRRREDPGRAFHMEDRSHRMQTYESSARDYIERSRRGPRQYSPIPFTLPAVEKSEALENFPTPPRQRVELVCQTVSRDETCSEDTKISSFVKTAMEPHTRNT